VFYHTFLFQNISINDFQLAIFFELDDSLFLAVKRQHDSDLNKYINKIHFVVTPAVGLLHLAQILKAGTGTFENVKNDRILKQKFFRIVSISFYCVPRLMKYLNRLFKNCIKKLFNLTNQKYVFSIIITLWSEII